MEKLEMENTESVTLERYINNGVLNAEEVRLSIFDNPDNKIMLNETDEKKVLKENEKSKEVDPQKIVEKEVRKTEKKKDGQDKLIDKFEIEGELLPNSYYEIDIKDLETIEED
jgi:hypothetical protein